MMENCIFCKIARGEIPSKIVYESENFLAFLDVHPVTRGHTLIIPKKHFVNFLDLPSSLGQELCDVIKKVAEISFKNGAEGFNILMRNGKSAGQEVSHAHFHIVPRKKGDGINSLPV